MSSESHPSPDRSDDRSVRDAAPPDDVAELFDPVRRVVGRKWPPVVVYHLLSDGPMGFSELRRTIDGISSKMLSESLNRLEDVDVVDRTVLETKPVRVEYALTPRGEALEPLLVSMIRWGRDSTGPQHPETTQEAAEGPLSGAYTDGGHAPSDG